MYPTYPAYPTTLAAPWAAAPPRTKTGAFGDYFRGLSLVAWLFLLVVSFWWLKKWDDIYLVRETGMFKGVQYLGFAIALVAHFTLGFNVVVEQSIRFAASVKGRMLGGFCLLMLVLSPVSLTPIHSALYALATLGVLLVCHWAWQMDFDRFRRVMFASAVVLLAFLLLLVFHLGIGRGTVGGIQRNRFGQAALSGVICLFLVRGRVRWLGLAVGIALALVVNSRGTLLAFGGFVGAYTVLRYGFGRGVLFVLAAAAIGVALMAVPRIGDRVSDTLVNSVAKLHDKGRGLGSGLSGRWAYWVEGLHAFASSPAIGHGFRTRLSSEPGSPDYGAHSGYVNLLADAGVVGFVLVLGSFIYDFRKRFGVIQSLRNTFARQKMPAEVADTLNLNCVVCAFLVAEAALWMIEPLYLNLGATISILLILFFCAPYSLVKTPPFGYAPALAGGRRFVTGD